jgi:integrase
MKESSRPIIEHIPLFLNYCKETGLSIRTQKNYRAYLKKFIKWLEKENKNNLLPHELTIEDIHTYKEYLSYYTGGENGGPLKKITQNYYLIALRALLGYFTIKDIVSLLPDKISLLGGIKAEKRLNYLNLGQIKALLNAPSQSSSGGLRDRVILETLISTGLKISQLTKLNRNHLDDVPEEVLPWIKKYLKTRRDKNDALFINYKAKRGSMGGRLTARSIERIVRSYGRKIGLPFLITPEILRWARPQALSREEIIIKKIQSHKTFTVKSYSNKESIKIPFQNQEKKDNLSPTWHIVENIINKEIDWLKNNIPTLAESYKENPPFLKHDDSILRKIAILIVSGKVKAVEFIGDNENKDLWDNLTRNKNLNKINRHGELWHKKMMDVIHEYFKLRNYKIILEPVLNYGRADLGIYSDNNPLFVEVGTVSLFKLWYNLSVMKNVTFLIIPSENQVIELST